MFRRRRPKRERVFNPFKPTYSSRREEKRRRYRRERPTTRRRVFDRDGGRCRCPCHRKLLLKTDNPYKLANANEVPPRSQGGDPLDPRDVLIMAPECHRQYTEHKLRIEKVDPHLGCNGRVIMTGELANGKYVEHYASDPVCELDAA